MKCRVNHLPHFVSVPLNTITSHNASMYSTAYATKLAENYPQQSIYVFSVKTLKMLGMTSDWCYWCSVCTCWMSAGSVTMVWWVNGSRPDTVAVVVCAVLWVIALYPPPPTDTLRSNNHPQHTHSEVSIPTTLTQSVAVSSTYRNSLQYLTTCAHAEPPTQTQREAAAKLKHTRAADLSITIWVSLVWGLTQGSASQQWSAPLTKDGYRAALLGFFDN